MTSFCDITFHRFLTNEAKHSQIQPFNFHTKSAKFLGKTLFLNEENIEIKTPASAGLIVFKYFRCINQDFSEIRKVFSSIIECDQIINFR